MSFCSEPKYRTALHMPSLPLPSRTHSERGMQDARPWACQRPTVPRGAELSAECGVGFTGNDNNNNNTNNNN